MECFREDSQGQRSCSHQVLQGCGCQPRGSLTTSAPHPAFCSPVLHPQLSADSWACFPEAQKEALVWSCACRLSVPEPEPVPQPHKSWQVAGWAGNSGQGEAVCACLTPSQVPGVAFQGLLQSLLRKALEAAGYVSLP